MTDFAVVPGSLRRMANELEDATEALDDLAERIAEWTMNFWELGLVGAMAAYPKSYDAAVGEFADKIDNGAGRIGDVAAALQQVADHYVAKDAEYYHRFGYVGEPLGQQNS